MHQDIALSGDTIVEFTPPVLQGLDPKPVFFLIQPTYAERDEIGIRAYQLGTKPIAPETIRAYMLSELYRLKGDEQGEADAIFLENFWTRASEFENEAAAWGQQETQRILDCRELGFDPEADDLDEEYRKRPFPTDPHGPRDRMRVVLLTDFITAESQLVRDKLAQQESLDIRRQAVTVRMGLKGWNSAVKALPAMDENGVLSEASLNDLRAALPKELSQIAYRQLYVGIASLFSLSAEEVGNFDSPLGNASPPNGSASPSESAADGDGSSTTSPIEPIPADESAKTTETSSASTSASEARPSKRASKRGRTGNRS